MGSVVLALIKVPANLGLLALAALVGGESMGLPIPGETALIVAGVLADRGRFPIVAVIAVAAAAAIVGDNLGYLIGRSGGRRLLERPGPFERHRRSLIERGERFFDRHGPKAVFFARWVSGVRVTGAWMAGVNRMPWRSFLLWNALGGVLWAASIGLAAYLLGATAQRLLERFGLAGLAVAVVIVVVAVVVVRVRRRRSAA